MPFVIYSEGTIKVSKYMVGDGRVRHGRESFMPCGERSEEAMKNGMIWPS